MWSVTSILILWCLCLPIGPDQVLRVGYKASGGPTNNVAIVSGHVGGTNSAPASTTSFSFAGANVTSGNTVLCGVMDLGLSTFSALFLTKTAGTATVGTIALDQGLIGTASGSNTGIYRIPITGTGTVTLTYNDGTSNYIVLGCAEFSGVNATPLSTTSTAAGGPGVLHTTGSITTTDVGVLFYVASEAPNADFTRSWSDTIVFHVDTGASTGTAIIQYKIINASPNTMQDCTGATTTLPGGTCTVGGDSELWNIAYALYKSS